MTDARKKPPRLVTRAQRFHAICCQLDAIQRHAFETFTPDEMDALARIFGDAAADLFTAADLERDEPEGAA